MRRQRLGAGLPAKADLAAELAVPHPAHIAWQARHLGAVGQGDRSALGFAIVAARDKGRRIFLDQRQMFARRRLEPDVIGRPAAAQRSGIGIQTVERGSEKFERAQEKPS